MTNDDSKNSLRMNSEFSGPGGERPVAARERPVAARKERPVAARKKRVWNHQFSIAFEIRSNREDAEDLTPMQILAALHKRLAGMNPDEFLENHDFHATFEEEE